MRTSNVNFRVDNAAEVPRLYLYDVIGEDLFGGISDQMVAEALDEVSKSPRISLHVNSPGGDVFVGHTIFNLLKAHPAKIDGYIDGLAGSIASEIVMACDTLQIAGNGRLMVHKPSWSGHGMAPDLRRYADLLDSLEEDIIDAYMTRVRLPEADVRGMVTATTWIKPDDALRMGFVDSVGDQLKIAACITPDIAKMLGYAELPSEVMEPKDATGSLEALEERINSRRKQHRP